MNKVKEKLQKLKESKNEPALFPYLQQLFLKMGYSQVEIVHGKDEFGKDLVFSEYDNKRKREAWTAVVVKNKDASMQDFEDSGEILRQVRLSFKHPFKDSAGIEHNISSVIIVINGKISAQAKSVIEKTIEPHLKANIITWNSQRLEEEIIATIQEEFLSDYEISYNNYKKAQIENLSRVENTKELFHGLTIKDINDIYVNAKTNYKKYKKSKDEYLTYDNDRKTIQRNEDIDESLIILKEYKDFFIYGLPTSGKTLLLKRIGINALCENLEKPIGVFFWELSKITSIEDFELKNEIEKQFFEYANEIFDYNNFSRLVIIFDALDELRDDNCKLVLLRKVLEFKIKYQVENEEIKRDKESLQTLLEKLESEADGFEQLLLLNQINELDAFAKSKPLQIIISSRDQKILQEYEILARFEKIELLPFDVGQALRLVKKLIPNSSTKSNKFIKAIKDGLLNNKLIRTPLALTLMAILYKEDQIDLAELPANITELYNKFTDFYLERWDSSKGISSQYKYEEARHILAMVAFYMHCKGIKFLSSIEIKEFLIRLSRKYDFQDLKNPEKFISSLKERPGLFQYDEENDCFYFYHLSFQEYFASIYFDDSSEKILSDNFFKEWWENTLVFYCGKQPKREVFIKSIFKEKIPVDLFQYYQYFTVLSKCLQANHLISKNLKKEILSSLIQRFDNFYKAIVKKDSENNMGITYSLTTLDFIMQMRDFFVANLNSKHISIDDLSDIFHDMQTRLFKDYSDVTIYCLSYLLTLKMRDPMFLIEFEKNKDLNVRWARIVYVDLQIMKLDEKIQHKLLSKIEKRQRTNKDFIKSQFKGMANKHLIDDHIKSIEPNKFLENRLFE